MKTIFQILGITLITLFMGINLQAQSIDHTIAKQYYQEAKTIAEKDNGKLWGLNLYGPLLFVDGDTKLGIANYPVEIDGWEEDHGIYFGKLPDNMGLANTAFEWNGVQWSMIIFKALAKDPHSRASLMMHELFHQHEEKLGLLSDHKGSKHLDQKMGRVSIFLEWNALLKACQSNTATRNKAIQDALSIRALRFETFPDAKRNETGKELHEGIAEYTGMTLSGRDDAGKINYLIERIADRSATKTMVWTFAYVAGPLYGYLLDQQDGDWTRKLKPGDDIGQLLSISYEVPYRVAHESNLEKIGEPYGYDSINLSESHREEEALALQDEFKRIFTDESVLYLPKNTLHIQFDPSQITPYGDVGTVYGNLTAQDAWGKLEVENSHSLLLQGWKGVLVPVGSSWNQEMGLQGPGWKFELNDGYKISRYKNGWQVIKCEESITIEDYPFPATLKKALLHTQKAFNLDDNLYEDVWPGYLLKRMPMAYWSPNFTCVLNTSEKPDGFQDTDILLNGNPVYYQEKPPFGPFMEKVWDSINPIYLLALQEWEEFRFNDVLFHEGFHTFQQLDPVLKDNYEKPADQPFFPIYNPDFYALGYLEQQILKEAMLSKEKTTIKALLAKYLLVLNHRQRYLNERSLDYEMKSNFHEGTATYVGYRSAVLLTNQNLVLAQMAKRLDKELINPGDWRNRGYGVGGSLAFLFDIVKPGWIEQLNPESTLKELVEEIVINEKCEKLSLIKKRYDYKSIYSDFKNKSKKEKDRLIEISRLIVEVDHVEITLPKDIKDLGMNYDPLGIDRVSEMVIFHQNSLMVWTDFGFSLNSNGQGLLAELNEKDLFNINKLLFAWNKDASITIDGEKMDEFPSNGIYKFLNIEMEGLSLEIENVEVKTKVKGGIRIIELDIIH